MLPCVLQKNSEEKIRTCAGKSLSIFGSPPLSLLLPICDELPTTKPPLSLIGVCGLSANFLAHLPKPQAIRPLRRRHESMRNRYSFARRYPQTEKEHYGECRGSGILVPRIFKYWMYNFLLLFVNLEKYFILEYLSILACMLSSADICAFCRAGLAMPVT